MVVTRELLKGFHKIDRVLFTRLVFSLSREVNQSLEVFGFLFLLEQVGYADDLIEYLLPLPLESLEMVANEIVVCLHFLYNKSYSTPFFVANKNNGGHSIIPSVIEMTGGRFTFVTIHENRDAFLLRLKNNLSNICIRAFEDISARARLYNEEEMSGREIDMVIQDLEKLKAVLERETNKTEEEAPKKEEEEEKEVVLAADERTFFLTFFQGDPVSEEEVRTYFTKRFGEVIEAMEMQEVKENAQPLYARVVFASVIEEMESVGSRKNLTIDGKHVWIHKYVNNDPTPSP